MGKPRMYGYYKPFTPNSKADRRKGKPFKKGSVKVEMPQLRKPQDGNH